MNDLISRAAAIDYLMTNMGWRDEDGYEVDDADEKRAIITDLLNGVPAIDAIPVEWLVNHKNEYAREGREQAEGDLMNLLLMWKKEQEAR